jgi:penicillin-binding protein 1A
MLNNIELVKKYFLGMLSFAILGGFIAIGHLEANLPDVHTLKDIQLQVPLKIYSADNKLMAEYGQKRRSPIKIEQVPQLLIDAVIATEDHRFYHHPGVDLHGIGRAVVNLISKGTKEQGGSTITMQVARNFFLTRKKTYTRKLNEILLALKIEQELTKQEILELYLNKIYFGKQAYGVAAAAEVYYGTTVDKLNLAQMAMIAGLPQAPSAINPINAPEAATKRRSHVLNKMLEYGYISQEQFDEANTQALDAKYHGRSIELDAPYVAEMVRQTLVEKFGEQIYDEGYEVFTTVDSKSQLAANNALARALLEYDQRHGVLRKIDKINLNKNQDFDKAAILAHIKKHPPRNNLYPAVVINTAHNYVEILLSNGNNAKINLEQMAWASNNNTLSAEQILKVGDVIYTYYQDKLYHLGQAPEVEGALVAINPNNGAIVSLVGGFDFEQSRYNRAVQAERQPGSAFKPFIYAAAIENGYSASTIINDAPIVESDPIAASDWRPKNYNLTFNGPTRLREALTQSRNLVSIRLLKQLGVEEAIKFIQKFGISEKSLPKSLSLALGSNHINPLELARSYSVFANGGYRIEPYVIQKIKDYNGQEIYTAQYPEVNNGAEQVMSAQTSYIITSMLQDVVQHGTARKAKILGRSDIAGKTGTTNDQFDGWYAGYNRDLVAISWVGFDEPKSLKEYAVKAALPMWIYYIQEAMHDKPENPLMQPDNMVTVKIDPKTGLLAHSDQEDAVYEIYKAGTEPKSQAPAVNAVSSTEEIEEIF